MWQTLGQRDGSVREVTCQCANELSSFFLPIVTVEAGQKDPLQRPATVIRMEHQWLKDRHDMKWWRFGIYSSKILVHVHGLYKRTNERHQFCGMWKKQFPLVYHQGMQTRWDISRYFWHSKGRFSKPKNHHKWGFNATKSPSFRGGTMEMAGFENFSLDGRMRQDQHVPKQSL